MSSRCFSYVFVCKRTIGIILKLDVCPPSINNLHFCRAPGYLDDFFLKDNLGLNIYLPYTADQLIS